MGSLFDSSTSTPTVPTVPTTYIRDEINNVETVPVKNDDGTITYITRALELSDEEQAEQDKLTSIMQSAMDEIVALSSEDYVLDEDSLVAVDAWASERQALIDDTYSSRTDEEEKELARRGLGDSSAGLNTRRQRQLDKQDAQEVLEDGKDALESDIRRDQISLQQSLYNLASNANNSTEAAQQKAATQGLSLLAANSAAQQASLTDYYNYRNTSSSSSVFSSLASSLLNSVNTAGSNLGTLFR